MPADPHFQAAHVGHRGSLHVALPPPAALALFTPRGEELWVPGWKPLYLYPPDGTTAEGGVFLTDTDGHRTYWLVTRWEPEAGEAAYARITPSLHAVAIAIRCSAEGAGTRVEVSYRLTALSEAGAALLGEWTEAWFAQMMRTWDGLIADHLRSAGNPAP